ncbi:MAG: hypothetical protein QXN66_05960 [Thermoplasmatales archaeon]
MSGNFVKSRESMGIAFTSGVDSISTDIYCSWSWYNELKGIVSWNFNNESNFQQTAALYRNGYYFGNAFWPVYLQTGLTSWASRLSPLLQKSPERNTAPMGILDFGKGNRIVAFLFTLAPGQEWSILEGGFTRAYPPMNPVVYGTKLEKTGRFCVGYDEKQVEDWDRQTSSFEKGYSPNPAEVDTVEVQISAYASYVQLFNGDLISEEPCGSITRSPAAKAGSGDDLEDIVGNILRIFRSI